MNLYKLEQACKWLRRQTSSHALIDMHAIVENKRAEIHKKQRCEEQQTPTDEQGLKGSHMKYSKLEYIGQV
eukprot:2000543-Pleurochrysis_carterae.AAC.3